MENVNLKVTVPENRLESIINKWIVIKGDIYEPDSQSIPER
jgi:hypothetical protein